MDGIINENGYKIVNDVQSKYCHGCKCAMKMYIHTDDNYTFCFKCWFQCDNTFI